ncbi:hypothetical protein P43SY_004981 [Pythium insidiosum]|uniref:Cilia- and flagella-associated protein 69 ARM repeats domain-containing protein n=1 Tax=Pythium insidiosum TaxID=114742 RepID=A0AAD5M7I5_PYTIN|nr:hypothetical protein P43SY_004981 [Pythium insidiosum]
MDDPADGATVWKMQSTGSNSGGHATRQHLSTRASAGAATESSADGFRKLFASVSDPQTQENHARHLALTKNILWRLVDLPVVSQLLELLRDKVQESDTFVAPLLAAITLCGKPFVRLKANEEITHPHLLTSIVPTLAQLLSFALVDVQVAAAEALRQFAIGACLTRPSTKTKSNNSSDNTSSTDDLRLPTRVLSQNVMEETGAVDLIVGVFHDLFPEPDEETPTSPSPEKDSRPSSSPAVSARESENGDRPSAPPASQGDPERLERLTFPLVDLVYELSSHQRCAEVLVVTGALHYIVFLLASISSPQDELLPLCLTILWNMLELSEEKTKSIQRCASRRELLVQFRLRNATFFLSTPFTFHVLLQTLELLLTLGHRKHDKELRNECVLILLLLARRTRTHELFQSSGLTACLLTYATSSETRRPARTDSSPPAIVADAHRYATNSAEDLEFKQSLWLLVARIASDHAENLQTVVQFRFLDVLFSYAVDAHSGPASSLSSPPHNLQSYSVAQLQQLQATALNVLQHLAPPLLDHVLEIGGHAQLLEMLQLGTASEEIQTGAWLLLQRLAPPEPVIQDALGRLDAVDIALDAFRRPPSRTTFALRRNALLTCAQLCRQHDANRRRFARAHGVPAVVRHLDLDGANAVLHENLLIAVLDAVRACVVGLVESETAFLRADGVPKLLDIIECAPKAIKNQALAALAEICVNPAAIPSFRAWRSETSNGSAYQLLLRIYANEEAVEEKENQASGNAQAKAVDASNVRSSAFRSVATCRSPFVVFPSSEDDPAAAPSEPTALSQRPTSPAFARLKEALRAAQTLAPTPLLARDDSGGCSGREELVKKARPTSVLDVGDHEFHPALNLKAKIHAVLANVSFACDGPEALSPEDSAMLEVAKEYPTFRVGEMWQNVEAALAAEGVRPIYADALHIRSQIEHAYNIAVDTKHAHRDIAARDRQDQARQEREFHARILREKQQAEQAEAFHRATRHHSSTMKLHLDAKRTRLEFMRKQDPTAFAVYEREAARRIEDPPPEFAEELSSLAQKEREIRGRLSTIHASPKRRSTHQT